MKRNKSLVCWLNSKTNTWQFSSDTCKIPASPTKFETLGITSEIAQIMQKVKYRQDVLGLELCLMETNLVKIEFLHNQIIASFTVLKEQAILSIKKFLEVFNLKSKFNEIVLKDIRLDQNISVSRDAFIFLKADEINAKFADITITDWFSNNTETNYFRYNILKELWKLNLTKRMSYAPQNYLLSIFPDDFAKFIFSIKAFGSIAKSLFKGAHQKKSDPASQLFSKEDFSFIGFSTDHLNNIQNPEAFCVCLSLFMLVNQLISEHFSVAPIWHFPESRHDTKTILITTFLKSPEAIFSKKTLNSRLWRIDELPITDFIPSFVRLFLSLTNELETSGNAQTCIFQIAKSTIESSVQVTTTKVIDEIIASNVYNVNNSNPWLLKQFKEHLKQMLFAL